MQKKCLNITVFDDARLYPKLKLHPVMYCGRCIDIKLNLLGIEVNCHYTALTLSNCIACRNCIYLTLFCFQRHRTIYLYLYI